MLSYISIFGYFRSCHKRKPFPWSLERTVILYWQVILVVEIWNTPKWFFVTVILLHQDVGMPSTSTYCSYSSGESFSFSGSEFYCRRCPFVESSNGWGRSFGASWPFPEFLWCPFTEGTNPNGLWGLIRWLKRIQTLPYVDVKTCWILDTKQMALKWWLLDFEVQ